MPPKAWNRRRRIAAISEQLDQKLGVDFDRINLRLGVELHKFFNGSTTTIFPHSMTLCSTLATGAQRRSIQSSTLVLAQSSSLNYNKALPCMCSRQLDHYKTDRIHNPRQTELEQVIL